MKLLISLLTSLLVTATVQAADTKAAYFAGGCFWCMEADFEKLDGVEAAISGYMGGYTAKPNYHSVSTGTTGHAETVKVIYDPSKVSYEDLLAHFWKNVDPLTPNAQFCDKGPHYRTAIFSLDENELALAEASKKKVAKQLNGTVFTEIGKASHFTEAEEDHQDYYKKNPVRYNYYRYGCGRDKRLKELWGDKS